MEYWPGPTAAKTTKIYSSNGDLLSKLRLKKLDQAESSDNSDAIELLLKLTRTPGDVGTVHHVKLVA